MTLAAFIEVARSVGIGAAAVLVTWLGVKQTGRKQKTDTAQQMFDQLQEERDAARESHAADMARMENRLQRAEDAAEKADQKAEKLAEDMRASHKRELLRDDFIQDLRNHIRLGLGPPPPDWPEELRRG